MKKLFSVFLIIIIVSSCSIRVEKRKHMKGYFVEFSRKNKSVSFRNEKINSVNKFWMIENDCSAEQKILDQENITASDNSMPAISASPIKKAVTAVNKTSGNHKKANAGNHSPGTAQSVSKLNTQHTTTSSEKNRRSDNWFLLISGLTASSIAFVFRKIIPNTRRMGQWALNNRIQVRALHFLMNAVVAAGGFFLGGLLYQSGHSTSGASTFTLGGIASALILFYPHRKQRFVLIKNSYHAQKWFAFALAFTGFLFSVNLGNRYASEKYLQNTYQTISVTDKNYFSNGIEYLNSHSTDEKKGLSDSDRKALAALVIISCIILCVLIAAVACALACSGMVVLSILVMVAGFPVIILGAVKLVNNLLGPVREKRKINPAPKPN